MTSVIFVAVQCVASAKYCSARVLFPDRGCFLLYRVAEIRAIHMEKIRYTYDIYTENIRCLYDVRRLVCGQDIFAKVQCDRVHEI